MQDQNQTGVSTESNSVSPALNQTPPVNIPSVYTPTTSTGTTIYPPAPAPAPSVDPNLLANYERRVRDLQSAKDQTQRQYEQAVHERLAVQQKLDALEATHQAMTSAAADNLKAALDRQNALDAEKRLATAENAKLQALMQRPELARYAEFLPATEDTAKLAEAIAKLDAIRQQDLAAQLANQPVPQLSATDPRTILNSNSTLIPPAAPARPPTASSGSNVAESIQQTLALAAEEARAKNDPSIWDRAMAEAARQAAAQQ